VVSPETNKPHDIVDLVPHKTHSPMRASKVETAATSHDATLTWKDVSQPSQAVTLSVCADSTPKYCHLGDTDMIRFSNLWNQQRAFGGAILFSENGLHEG